MEDLEGTVYLHVMKKFEWWENDRTCELKIGFKGVTEIFTDRNSVKKVKK